MSICTMPDIPIGMEAFEPMTVPSKSQVAHLRVAAEESGSEDRVASLVAREGCIWANLFVYALDDARYQVGRPLFHLGDGTKGFSYYRKLCAQFWLDGAALSKSAFLQSPSGEDVW